MDLDNNTRAHNANIRRATQEERLEMRRRWTDDHIDLESATARYYSTMKDAAKDKLPPMDLFSREMDEMRVQIEEDLQDTEDEIAEIDSQMRALETRRQVLINTANPLWQKLRVCVNPFRRVPPEILQEIALLALPSRPSIARYESPISLAQVSSSWRWAVFAFPRLWNELYFEIGHDLGAPPSCKYSNAVEAWFERTASNALSFHLYIMARSSNIEQHEEDFRTHFVDRLRSVFLRVRHLGIVAPWILDFGSIFKDPLDNLESLVLKSSRGSLARSYLAVAYDTGGGHTPFQPTPQLRRLALRYPISDSGLSDAMYQWSRLTALSIHKVLTITQYVKVLEVCHQLVIGQFGFYDPRAWQRGSLSAGSHTCIEQLCVRIIDHDLDITHVFDAFQLPKLKHLEITHLGAVVEGAETRPRHVAPYMVNVRSLIVSGNWGAGEEALKLYLMVSHSLTHLRICLALDPEEIFRIMLSSTDMQHDDEDDDNDLLTHGIFLRNLSTLWIDIPTIEPSWDVGYMTVQLGLMLEALTSIQIFRLSVADDRTREALAPILKPYTERGMDFHMCSNYPDWDWIAQDSSALGEWEIEIEERAKQHQGAAEVE